MSVMTLCRSNKRYRMTTTAVILTLSLSMPQKEHEELSELFPVGAATVAENIDSGEIAVSFVCHRRYRVA